jgi:hypothetical protein
MHCHGLYLHLRRRPMGYGPTHVPSHLPGAIGRLYVEEAKELALAPAPVSGSPATEPSGPVAKLDPLDYLQPVLSIGLSPPLDPGGSQWPKYPPSGRLISWLLGSGASWAWRLQPAHHVSDIAIAMLNWQCDSHFISHITHHTPSHITPHTSLFSLLVFVYVVQSMHV